MIFLCMYSGEYDVCGVTPSAYPHPVVGSIPTVARHIFKLAHWGYTLRVTPQKAFVHVCCRFTSCAFLRVYSIHVQ